MEKVNKQGKTLKQFLSEYNQSDYPQPSITVDVALLAKKSNKILLIRRGNHPFIYDFALPGGFLNPNESCEQAAARELYEETLIKSDNLTQLVTVSTPNRDPRCRIVTVVFLKVIEDTVSAVGSDDACDARWFNVRGEWNDDVLWLTLFDEKGEFSPSAKLKIVKEGNRINFDRSIIIKNDLIAGDHSLIIAQALLTAGLLK